MENTELEQANVLSQVRTTLAVPCILMHHSLIRQTFKFENNFSTVELELPKFSEVVKFGRKILYDVKYCITREKACYRISTWR